MPFPLNYPGLNAQTQELQLEPGQMLFVLGSNGTGKSSLMYCFSNQNMGHARKISAHRQTWLNSDALDLTPSTKLQTERNIQDEDRQQTSRYQDVHAAERPRVTIYDLVDAENVRARAMAAAYDACDMDQLATAAKVEAPITVINELLHQSNIQIDVTIRANERVMASKNGGVEYSAAELSDGERSALLLAGNVLTAPKDTLLVIDEPERHLHRSIISPLLGRLFERRPDCGFVISTHDPDLPLEFPKARILLLRSCSFGGQKSPRWEADKLPVATPIDDALKRDLLGARRTILFVEGTESSLDKLLYSLVFPTASVIPKATCTDVERAVLGARASHTLHWLQAFGITDGDGLDTHQIAVKRERGVYALPYYSVEAIYFHPRIVKKIAARQALVSGEDGAKLAQTAIAAGIAAINAHTERLSQNASKKAARQAVIEQIPNDDDILAGLNIQIENSGPTIHAARKKTLDAAVAGGDWEAVLKACPVRESDALESISSTLGFKKRWEYERAVRHLLTEGDDSLQFVRDLFEGLATEVLASSKTPAGSSMESRSAATN